MPTLGRTYKFLLYRLGVTAGIYIYLVTIWHMLECQNDTILCSNIVYPRYT